MNFRGTPRAFSVEGRKGNARREKGRGSGRNLFAIPVLGSLCLFCSLSNPTFLLGQEIAIEAETVYTMGPLGTITNGLVLVGNGKITAVGQAGELRFPTGSQRLRAKIVTPGLVDAKSSVGLSGFYGVPADQDHEEASNPNTAELRALDSFNPQDPLLTYIRRYGVTTVQTGPGETNPIAGQAGIFKTFGERAEEMAVRPFSAMIFNLGERPKAVYGQQHKLPSTRMATAAIIRKALVEAQHYLHRWEGWRESEREDPLKQPARDLKLEALGQVLEGKVPAIFVAHRTDDILTALRLAREFKLKLILSQATEGYLVRDLIRHAGVPVLVGPTLQRLDALETNNATLENPALLAEAGISIAFSAGLENYVPKQRVLLFEVAVAAVNGLGFERGLRAATIDAARILGIADRVGSLEPGKDADVVLFDGDPIEYTSHVQAVLVNGKVIYRREP